jgi:hypothetical protein
MSKVMVYIITILDDQQPSCKGGMNGSSYRYNNELPVLYPFCPLSFHKTLSILV